LMANHPVFPFRTVKDYSEFLKLTLELDQTNSQKPPLKFFFPSFNPFQWRVHEFFIAGSARKKAVTSPLAIQYWSMTAYQFGANNAVKFTAIPSPQNAHRHQPSPSANYLREAMVEHLRDQEATFDFCIQLQTDPEQMPIEDPSIEWKSAFQKVATIKIPAQPFDDPEQMQTCERLVYTPWHCLPDHRPLGGLNRSRKAAYEATAKMRQV
jgi:hypothetical protein